MWNQYIQKFDASLLKPGENEMTFTVPAGDVTTGVVWDYLRLELNDGSKAYPGPPDNSVKGPTIRLCPQRQARHKRSCTSMPRLDVARG